MHQYITTDKGRQTMCMTESYDIGFSSDITSTGREIPYI
jgi:hypothetical protein